MSLESRSGRTFLDQMLEDQRDEHRRRPFDFQVLDTYKGRLTVYTRPIEKNPWSDVTGEVVYGCLGDKVVFHRDRRRAAKEDGGSSLEFVQWLMLLEGPLANIRYFNGWDGKRELDFGFLVPRLAVGRQGKYSINDGNFQEMGTSWSQELLAGGTEGHKLEIGEVPKKDAIHLEGRLNGRLVEDIVLPWHIDLATWLPVFLDENDLAINDPRLPWQDWFKNLGLELHSFPENIQDGSQSE